MHTRRKVAELLIGYLDSAGEGMWVSVRSINGVEDVFRVWYPAFWEDPEWEQTPAGKAHAAALDAELARIEAEMEAEADAEEEAARCAKRATAGVPKPPAPVPRATARPKPRAVPKPHKNGVHSNGETAPTVGAVAEAEPKGGRNCASDLLALLGACGTRLTAGEAAAALEERGQRWPLAEVRETLAELLAEGRVDDEKDERGDGYGLAEWTGGA